MTADGKNVRVSLLTTTYILFGPKDKSSDVVATLGIRTLSSWPKDDPNIWCWHCCHPCGATPLPLPIAHNPKTDVFTVYGAFCGWGCMRAYARDTTLGHVASVRAQFLSLFRKRCEPQWKFQAILPAPPRQMLQVFGGPLSIEQFRASSEQGVSYSILPAKMMPLTQILEEQRKSNKQRVSAAEDLAEHVSFEDVSQKNETLRLRRSKPLKADKNVLERAMGINAFLQVT